MNEIGYIQIHRQLLNWEWYSDIPVRLTFIHLLIIANWNNSEWKGTVIKRGQVVVGRKKLSKEIGISEQQLRTSLVKLKSTQEITIKSTNKYSVVTLVKYNDYQDEKKKSTNKKTDKQPTNNQQSTTTKESNKVIINKTIIERKTEFNNSLCQFDEKYKMDMLKDFSDYWTEHNEKGKKMRFEYAKNQPFNLSLRLATWLKRQKSFKKEKSSAEKETSTGNLNDALEYEQPTNI